MDASSLAGTAFPRGDGVLKGDYTETERERRLEFRHEGRYAAVSLPKEGYGMLVVEDSDGEVERYYGFDMALDHAAELLGVSPGDLEVPEEARDMGI